jgi:hypothetical protein
MTMIRCSECGRSISDRAPACVGCGAPIANNAGFFAMVPTPSEEPPLSRRQLSWRVALAALTLVLGVIAVSHVEHMRNNRIVITLATLLLIGGLCWTIVAILQKVAARRQP